MVARFAWARLNAYGLMFAGLMLLSVGDIITPEMSTVARIIGRVPELQPAWAVGYLIAAVLLIVGFLRARTVPELAALGLLALGVSVQTVVILSNVGTTQPGLRAIAIWVVVVGCSALRASVLLSPKGLTVTIPGRSEAE